jgi:hypothetical protein
MKKLVRIAALCCLMAALSGCATSGSNDPRGVNIGGSVSFGVHKQF